jgi:TrmH family RNA methyltransferase
MTKIVDMDISSLQNPRIKNIIKLRERRMREKEGLMLVEGYYELEIALNSGLHPETIFMAPELVGEEMKGIDKYELLTVSRSVFEKMAYRENPDGWLAVFPTPRLALEDLTLGNMPFVIIAESIEKPGNLGAILRTADAAGVDAILVCDPLADLYNPNVVRASRGTVFTVPAVQITNAEALRWLRECGVKIFSASPAAQLSYENVDFCEPVGIAVGSEDEGLSDFWLNNADATVRIPMYGKVNSLNVSISTAIIAYEVVRQRKSRQL